MTVSTTESVVEYVSGGPAFPIPYRFLQNADIEAVLIKQDGTSETLTGVQYTLTGAGSQSGGTLTSSYAAGVLATPGASLTISRVMDAVQPTDLRNQGKYLAETHENVFDRLTMLIQQGFSGLSRALKRPIGKSYFDAEGRRIANVADPVSQQDATTRFWTERYVGDLVSAIQGPVNNAANIFFQGADGSGRVVQDLSGVNGAAYLGWRGGQVSEFLDAGFFMPNDLDLTGVVDESSKINSYLATYKRVRLPAGTVRATAGILVPSGCSLVGSGATLLNRFTKQWAGGGTTVVGTVLATGSAGFVIGEMNVDAYATGDNAIAGVNDQTRDGLVYRVNTRANNHGHLWEQNSSDATGMTGGNIVVTDCKHYDGPNGFVTKMRAVQFIRCLAFDTTVQAFVVVSDNINGPSIYSRATKTKIIACGGDGNHQGVTVYSRDVFSENNANGVSGTQDTEIDVSFTNIGNCSVHTGFYAGSTAGFTPLFNDNVTITGGNYSDPGGVFQIRFDDAARPRVLGGYFSHPNPVVYGTNCADPYVDTGSVSVYDPNTMNPGALSAFIVESSGASAINVDVVSELLVVRNTVPTALTQLVTGNRLKTIKVLIDDTFTTLAVGGISITGKGATVELLWDSRLGIWRSLGGSTQLPEAEVQYPYSLVASLGWRSKSGVIVLGGNINLLDIAAGSATPGASLTLRITSPAAYNIFNWQGVTWGTVTPVGPIAAGETVIIQFYYTGTTFVAMRVNRY